jgi:predicted RNA binding protein YcfA (HicA-like mRNA interferase family)
VDMRRLAQLAREQGWTMTRTGGNHVLWTGPSGHRVVVPSSPSDHRSLPNTINHLRQAGLDVPRKRAKKKVR